MPTSRAAGGEPWRPVAALAAVLFVACTSPSPSPRVDPPVVPGDDLARARGFLDGLPACDASTVERAIAFDSATAEGGPKTVAMRSTLNLGGGFCTLMACGGVLRREGPGPPVASPPPVCCNECRGGWMLGATRDASIESALVLLDEHQPLGWRVMDCRLESLKALLPVDVVATGTLRAKTRNWAHGVAEFVETELCVVRATKGSDATAVTPPSGR